MNKIVIAAVLFILLFATLTDCQTETKIISDVVSYPGALVKITLYSGWLNCPLYYQFALSFGFKEEADIVEKLRSRVALTLSLVAVQDGEIIRHITFCPVIIESSSSDFKVITLAPLSVIPEHQRRGIGSQLVHAVLEECRRIGHEIIVVLGHPTYYPRFGFIQAM